MTPGMTIVCATHFSDTSFTAVRVAAELARRHRQLLWLVTVLPGPGVADAEGLEHASRMRDALMLEVAALASPELDVRSRVLHGKVDEAVGLFCRDRRARLLVVGDTEGKIGPLLTGTLDRFVDEIEVPMLVVRDPRPFTDWATGTGPLKVLLALDDTFSSSVARDWVGRLAEYGALDLVVAHIWWPQEEYDRRGIPAPSKEEAHAGLAAKLLEETQAALAGLPSNVKHRVLLEVGKGHVAQQLQAMAERAQVDVLVLGTHPASGAGGKLGSIAHDVLANALMSVVCVPGHARLPASFPAERPTAPNPVVH